MAETLDSLAAKIDALGSAIDNRFEPNTAGHLRFEQRLDNHELRLIALESRRPPPKPS